jgi:phage gpG-like protein
MATSSAKSGQAFVSIQAPNAELISRRLRRYAQRTEDARPAFRLMEQALERSEQEIFDSQGGAIGEHWPSAADPQRKRDPRLLVASGTLMRSLSGMSSGAVREIQMTRMRFGTSVPYGRFHEYGTKRGLPSRPFMGLSENQARQLLNIMHEYSVRYAEGSGP